ncbi:MAG TPA: hypothetical protein VFA60_07410 [Terriglobales bacterium]|nr:hypothetical protein [Terriglobales bacterium]
MRAPDVLAGVKGRRSKLRLYGFVAVLLAALAVRAADKKKQATFVRLAGKEATLGDVPVVVARQPCGNWSWAAALETSLRMQGAPIAQTYWILKVNRGEVCEARAGDFDELARVLESDYYVLDDGSKVRLKVDYRPGPPTAPELVIASVLRKAPMMLEWRDRTYLLTGVVYDEYIAPNGGRFYELRELRLLDTTIDPAAKPAAPAGPPPSRIERRRDQDEDAPRPSADPRLVTFVKGRDDPGEIGGTFQVTVVR